MAEFRSSAHWTGLSEVDRRLRRERAALSRAEFLVLRDWRVLGIEIGASLAIVISLLPSSTAHDGRLARVNTIVRISTHDDQGSKLKGLLGPHTIVRVLKEDESSATAITFVPGLGFRSFSISRDDLSFTD